jgi:cytochrome c553
MACTPLGTSPDRGALPALYCHDNLTKRIGAAMGSRQARASVRVSPQGFWPALLLCLAPAIAPAAVASGPAGSEQQAALAARPDAARGASLYGTCAACHGPGGAGVTDGTIPAIAGQPQRVLVKQLADFRRSQRLDIRMEHFADRRHLEGAQDLADVAAHIAGLPRQRPAGIGNGASLETGTRAWFVGCAGCHGATGKPDAERMLPRLAGQHAAYLERQLLDAADGRRPNMGRQHRSALQRLSATEIAGISDYLSRLD